MPKPLLQRGLGLLVGGFAEKAGLWRMRGWSGPGDYFRFLSQHPRRLGFCLLWTAASGLGQTFFLSLFQPYWIESLQLTPAGMGLIYGAATLLSASLLGKLGAWVDRTKQGTAALVAALGLAVGCGLGAVSPHWSALFVAIALLRFFGQGLSAMLGTTSAARWFREDQSKAVSVAGLGYPLGEATLPFLVMTAIATIGWRASAGASAALALLVIWPVSLLLLRGREPVLRQAPQAEGDGEAEEAAGRAAPVRSIYREKRFYQMLAVTAPLPFFATGIIFFQASLAEQLAWGPKAFAVGFFCFAVVRAGFSLGMGALADRIGARRLLGSPLLFFSVGLLAMALLGPPGIYGFFVCMGLAFGVSGAITTPVWGELFGVERLGEARGASASVTVFATALSPALFGVALDFGLAVRPLLLASAGVILVGIWPLSIRLRRLRL